MNIAKTAFATILLLLLASVPVGAQDDDDAPETVKLLLKSGEYKEGTLKKVDADGVTLVIENDLVIFFKWNYLRGDKHLKLRKRATDFRKVGSLLKLADFCHEFALDEDESRVLAAALKRQPTNSKIRERIKALPAVENLDLPRDPNADPEETEPEDTEPEDTEPEDTEPEDTEPEDSLPPPTRGRWRILIEVKNDDVAQGWFDTEFKDLGYKTGTRKDYEIKLVVETKMTITRNPKFFGKELYAICDGEVTYKLYKKGEKKPFDDGISTVKDVRSNDGRVKAISRCRRETSEKALKAIHAILERMR